MTDQVLSDDELIEQLVKYQGRDRVVHFIDFMVVKSLTPVKRKVFKSQFTEFENRMCGIETGEIVVITGHRKEGKTLFAESWLKSMMVSDSAAKSMILSYEVPVERILEKYTPEENIPIYVPMSLEAMNFKWLEDRCKEAKFKYNCKIVMIDHLHFMVDMAVQQNMSPQHWRIYEKFKTQNCHGFKSMNYSRGSPRSTEGRKRGQR